MICGNDKTNKGVVRKVDVRHGDSGIEMFLLDGAVLTKEDVKELDNLINSINVVKCFYNEELVIKEDKEKDYSKGFNALSVANATYKILSTHSENNLSIQILKGFYTTVTVCAKNIDPDMNTIAWLKEWEVETTIGVIKDIKHIIISYLQNNIPYKLHTMDLLDLEDKKLTIMLRELSGDSIDCWAYTLSLRGAINKIKLSDSNINKDLFSVSLLAKDLYELEDDGLDYDSHQSKFIKGLAAINNSLNTICKSLDIPVFQFVFRNINRDKMYEYIDYLVKQLYVKELINTEDKEIHNYLRVCSSTNTEFVNELIEKVELLKEIFPNEEVATVNIDNHPLLELVSIIEEAGEIYRDILNINITKVSAVYSKLIEFFYKNEYKCYIETYRKFELNDYSSYFSSHVSLSDLIEEISSMVIEFIIIKYNGYIPDIDNLQSKLESSLFLIREDINLDRETLVRWCKVCSEVSSYRYLTNIVTTSDLNKLAELKNNNVGLEDEIIRNNFILYSMMNCSDSNTLTNIDSKAIFKNKLEAIVFGLSVQLDNWSTKYNRNTIRSIISIIDLIRSNYVENEYRDIIAKLFNTLKLSYLDKIPDINRFNFNKIEYNNSGLFIKDIQEYLIKFIKTSSKPNINTETVDDTKIAILKMQSGIAKSHVATCSYDNKVGSTVDILLTKQEEYNKLKGELEFVRKFNKDITLKLMEFNLKDKSTTTLENLIKEVKFFLECLNVDTVVNINIDYGKTLSLLDNCHDIDSVVSFMNNVCLAITNGLSDAVKKMCKTLGELEKDIMQEALVKFHSDKNWLELV